MATVDFKCPKCGQVCAFSDRHVGRRARCTKCSTYFLIPAIGQPARAIKSTMVEDGPWSGFWSAAIKKTPKAMLHPDSLISAVVMVFFSVLRFLIGHPFYVIYVPFFLFLLPVPVGAFVSILTVCSQCRYIFNIIQSTTEGNDLFPPFLDDTYVDRFFDGIISAYVFLALTGVFLSPAVLLYVIFKKAGVSADWLVIGAGVSGLFFLPLSMTIYAYSGDIILCFRVDYILKAVRKAFGPHLLLYVPTLGIAALFWHSRLYHFKAPTGTLLPNMMMHVLATGLVLFAARAAGLFYRHYGCYLP